MTVGIELNSHEASGQSAALQRGLRPQAVSPVQLAGVARDAVQGFWPLNGLRHTPSGDYSGWFLWGGPSLSDAPDYFQPQYIGHLAEALAEILPYLDLPPGWRFLIAPGYEDVWFDESLLDEKSESSELD